MIVLIPIVYPYKKHRSQDDNNGHHKDHKVEVVAIGEIVFHLLEVEVKNFLHFLD